VVITVCLGGRFVGVGLVGRWFTNTRMARARVEVEEWSLVGAYAYANLGFVSHGFVVLVPIAFGRTVGFGGSAVRILLCSRPVGFLLRVTLLGTITRCCYSKEGK